jgi:hypothetical protein
VKAGEQVVAVPVFADAPRNAAHRPNAQARRSESPRAYEGAHGELCYDWGDA